MLSDVHAPSQAGIGTAAGRAQIGPEQSPSGRRPQAHNPSTLMRRLADRALAAGRPVLVHLDLGPRESSDSWLSFLQDLSARGLAEPLMVIFDGAPGLKKAIKRMWPRVWRQRVPSTQDAKHLGQAAAPDAGADEAAGATGLPGARLRCRYQARSGADHALPGPVLGSDGLPRTGTSRNA